MQINKVKLTEKFVDLQYAIYEETNTFSEFITNFFQNSLADLMNKLEVATPCFIRCIKPNQKNAAGLFNREFVQSQLRYTGIHETIRIRQEGYALRLTFDEFIQR